MHLLLESAVTHPASVSLTAAIGFYLLVISIPVQAQGETGVTGGGGDLSSGDSVVYHEDSQIRRESVSILTKTGKKMWIGQRVDHKLISKSNVVIETDMFGVPFGPIPGFADKNTKVGWNNQKRILYVEALSREVATSDGLRIGATKEDVLKALGIPIMESASTFRYQNTEYEVLGILFLFDQNGRVERIILFGYV